MAVIPAASLQAIGDLILARVRDHGSVSYDSTWAGEDREITLRDAFGLDDDRRYSGDWVNWAVVMLEEWGIIVTKDWTKNPAMLTLTDYGRTFLAEGREFTYWDLDL
jgi:hypothetical protein